MGGVPYTWDANGNLLSDGVSTYSYDHNSRLTSVTQSGTTYQYSLNGLDERGVQVVGERSRTIFGIEMEGYNLDSDARNATDRIMNTMSWRTYAPGDPWDYGNPIRPNSTPKYPGTPPELFSLLQKKPDGNTLGREDDYQHAYYYSEQINKNTQWTINSDGATVYGVAFVLTKEQMLHLCEAKSCVTGLK